MDPAVRARCDELELAIERLLEIKLKMSGDEYFRGLETLLRVAPASESAR